MVVVATTDVHGHATDWDYVANQSSAGGLTRVATIVDSLRARYPGQVVLVDAGDLIQGDPFATYFARVAPRDPNPVIEAMNLTGYDVATPGNHDFDWGLGMMRQAFAGAAFPYVSGNLHTLPGDSLLFQPYAVLNRQGVRVGITGFTTPGTAVWNRDQLQGKLRVDRISIAAGPVIQALRRESDLVVALVHSGLGGAAPTTRRVWAVRTRRPRSPAFRTGPISWWWATRTGRCATRCWEGFTSCSPGPTAAASPSPTWIWFGRTGAGGRCGSAASSSRRLARSHQVGWSSAWRRPTKRCSSGRISRSARPPGRCGRRSARLEPTPILNFVNAVQLKRTGADLSAASAFDLRAGFDSGTIRMRQLVALYPFDNTLRAVRISGAQLKEYLEHSARYYRTDAGRANLDQRQRARLRLRRHRRCALRHRPAAPAGRPDPEPVVPAPRRCSRTDSFTLAVNSHRQTGAGGYGMLRGAPVVYDKGENIRDLLIEEIRSRKVIDPADYAAREWRIVPEGAASAVRALFRIPPRPLPVGARDTVLLRVLATTDLHGVAAAEDRLARAAERGGSRR